MNLKMHDIFFNSLAGKIVHHNYSCGRIFGFHVVRAEFKKEDSAYQYQYQYPSRIKNARYFQLNDWKGKIMHHNYFCSNTVFLRFSAPGRLIEQGRLSKLIKM